MKYITYTCRAGHRAAIVFDEAVTHRDAARALAGIRATILGAGFAFLGKGGWRISVESSESLRIGPSPHDQMIIRAMMEEGVSGLALENLLLAKGKEN